MIHLLFLVLFLVGSIFVYFNENYGRGLNWVREENYADTYSCTSQLESDVENIFKYVSYKNLLEKNGGDQLPDRHESALPSAPAAR